MFAEFVFKLLRADNPIWSKSFRKPYIFKILYDRK